MREAINVLKAGKPVFEKASLDKSASKAEAEKLDKAVLATIDKLAIAKDSLSFTFGPAIRAQINTYFKAIKNNEKAVRIYERDKRKYDRIVKSGKKPDWEVAAAAVTDLELVKKNIQHLIDRQVEHYEELLNGADARDYDTETVAVIDFLKENASGVIEKITKRIARDRAIKLMNEVGIAEPHKRYNQYPFEFSGGMRQRIVIAIALAANPDILICDEPTTALDVTIQSQILELINKLKEERKLTVIFITHDLGVVANMADRVAVMYAGKIVEYGTSEEIFYHSAHPYTWALLASMPDLDTNERLEAIPGTPPNMIYPPKGDAFAPRNKYAMEIDFEEQPPMFKITDTHYAATWLLHPNAPKVEPPKIVMERIRRMQEKRGQNNG
ncbi:MAG: ATP-binding cassette domain-containing protein [Lachnospiraceae bacterium]|nr:ATP-binding cassette domain-containing protein [Lachnospiraceae bacterium]